MVSGPLTLPLWLCLNSPMISAPDSLPSTAYVGLGSNLGDRLELLREGRRLLGLTPGILVLASSPIYLTAPMGGPVGQPDYFNAVLALQSHLGPSALLWRCLEIEALLGRQRLEHWGARTLDLDLLLFGQASMEERELILPHPRLHLRRFVLAPLADLAPDLIHPLLGCCVSELLCRCSDEGQRIKRHMETW